jgi:flagellar P-ring protein precursor FlgI
MPVVPGTVRVKDLGHFLGWKESALVGYGLVTGLSGSGDSVRSLATRQALSNVLSRLGANIPPDQLQSRNVAAVVVTASLPPTARAGDRIDLTVTSIGDARSLVGGTLLMTPLVGPDQKRYALGQGNLVVGGYDFHDNGNIRRKNYPTSGVVSGGGTVERPVQADLVSSEGRLTFVLRNADFTTAQRLADGLNRAFGASTAKADGADAVVISTALASGDVYSFISKIENVTIAPDQLARVVINERSGTVVAGGGVQISSVVIAQGDIKVSVDAEHELIYPYLYDGRGSDSRNFVYTDSKLDVSDAPHDVVVKFPNSTVADLVRALAKAKISTRTTISILQAMKSAGSLHAEIIVQ